MSEKNKKLENTGNVKKKYSINETLFVGLNSKTLK